MMTRLLVLSVLMTLVVLLGSAGGETLKRNGYVQNERLTNGGTYSGYLLNYKPHGQGTATYANGEKYVGEWRKGKRNGQGTTTYANGDKYVGEFRDGKYNGQGNYTHANGGKYVGEFRDGKQNGQGTYTLANGEKYVGEWRKGKYNGHGTLTFASGDKYVGEFRDDKLEGQGNYTHANGDKYVGEFRDGKQNGQGTYTLANGEKYVGEVKDDKRNGKGTLTLDNGDKYVGEFRDGKYNGHGTYFYLADNQFKGDKYVGEFRDYKEEGQGTYTYADGSKYVGEFKGELLQSGRGTKDRNFHGMGILTYADGRVEEGVWENGKFKYAQKVSPSITARKLNPRVDQPKRLELVRRIQKSLRVIGLYSGRIDGIIGTKTKSAIQQWQRRNGYPETGEVDDIQLAKLEQEATRRYANRTPPKPSPPTKRGTTGSGFFISKLGHIVTNEHVIRSCANVTVGDTAKKQVTVTVIETDKRNDLALLKISSAKLASADTKSLIRKLGIEVVPLASEGLLRSEDVELGERIMAAGYPYGEIFSDTIKVTTGVVSATRGLGDDTGQFQIDAAVQPGNSGGPIYDENGNIVGVVVAQLDKLKFAKAIGSLPENVNFGIKASTVRQFLTASGLPTKWSNRSRNMSTKDLAKIAKNQTVMVVCNP